jgi:hypothetical protein
MLTLLQINTEKTEVRLLLVSSCLSTIFFEVQLKRKERKEILEQIEKKQLKKINLHKHKHEGMNNSLWLHYQYFTPANKVQILKFAVQKIDFNQQLEIPFCYV